MRRGQGILCGLLACLLCNAAVAIQIVDLGTLGGSGSWSWADAVNENDEVIGTSVNGPGQGVPFLYSQGIMVSIAFGTVLDINNSTQIAGSDIGCPAMYDHGAITSLGGFGGYVPQVGNGWAEAINAKGQIVGGSYTKAPEFHAFVYEGGIITDLGCFQNESRPCNSLAHAINDVGQIVGVTNAYTSSARAFLYENGVMHDISNGWQSSAVAINNSGQVVGLYGYFSYNVARAFLYHNGTFTDIGYDGSSYTAPSSINDQGQVVGTTIFQASQSCKTCLSETEVHAFLWQNGTLIDLHDIAPGWELESATDINNKGHIVGLGRTNGQSRAYLLRLDE